MQQTINFSSLIECIRGLQPPSNFSLQLHIAFVGYIAGKQQNDDRAIKKALNLIAQVDNEEKENRMYPEDIIAFYQQFSNNNLNIHDLVPDELIEEQLSDIQDENNSNPQSQLSMSAANSKIEEFRSQIEQINQQNKKSEIFSQEQIMQKQSSIIGRKQYQQQQSELLKVDQQSLIPKIHQIKLIAQQQSSILKQQKNEEFRNDYKEFQRQSQIKQNPNKVIDKPHNIIIKEITTCSICWASFDQGITIILSSCSHQFHAECMINFAKSQSQLPLKCPFQGCQKELTQNDVDQICDDKLKNKLEQNSTNLFLQQSLNIFQCPTRGCQGIYEIEGLFQLCIICKIVFCTKCRKVAHEGLCGEQSFIRTAKQQHYSQCLMCFRWVEKIYGCNHIKCICNHEFCYNCGKQWVPNEECKCIETESNFRLSRVIGKQQLLVNPPPPDQQIQKQFQQ